MNLHRVLLLLLAALLLRLPVSAQSGLDRALPDLLRARQSATQAAADPAPDGTPLDAPVDAALYEVGPGDRYRLNIWSSSPEEFLLTVSPEGFLVIPTVGVANVRNMTLDSMRLSVLPVVSRKYPGARVDLTLLSSRPIVVHVSGQVLNEGRLEVNSVYRVDDLLAEANTLPAAYRSREFFESDEPRYRRQASERHVSIRRRDGTVRRVDLVKYALTGDGRFNPYLREGDVVHVPARRARDNNVAVLGGFIQPISVEFAEGDSVTDLVLMGHGLKERADPRRAVLAREILAGGMDTMRLDLEAVLQGRQPNIVVLPGDRLFVPEEPDQRAGDFVTIEGEVLRPGRYPIAPHGTGLKDIVARAGGFTRDANPGAAVLLRGRPEELDIPEEALLEQLSSARTTFEPADSGYYALETTLRLRRETVSVDFQRLFLAGDSTADVTLRHRDRLVVPRAQRTVYVFGQVLLPGHVRYAPGRSVDSYVELAGGYTAHARRSDTWVIKAGSRTWLKPSETGIDDGDFVWVPKEEVSSFRDVLATAAQISVILGSVATLVILAVTLK